MTGFRGLTKTRAKSLQFDRRRHVDEIRHRLENAVIMCYLRFAVKKDDYNNIKQI